MAIGASPAPLSPVAWTSPFSFSPLYLPGGITPSSQNPEMGKWIQVGVAVEASTGDRPRASRPATREEQQKRHLLATLPAEDAHPVHPHNLACEEGAGFRNPLLAPALSPRRSLCCRFSLFLGLLLLSRRLPQAAGTQASPAPARREVGIGNQTPATRSLARASAETAPLLPGRALPAAAPPPRPLGQQRGWFPSLLPPRPFPGPRRRLSTRAPSAGQDPLRVPWPPGCTFSACAVGEGTGGVATSHPPPLLRVGRADVRAHVCVCVCVCVCARARARVCLCVCVWWGGPSSILQSTSLPFPHPRPLTRSSLLLSRIC